MLTKPRLKLLTKAVIAASWSMPLAGQAVTQPPAIIPRPFIQLQAGALNPNDPFQTTLAYGVGAGLNLDHIALTLHVTRQSQNRNSGSDLGTEARTFVTAAAELTVSRARGSPPKQAFIRADLGFLLRGPFSTAPVAGIGFGWRFDLVHHIILVGTLFDDIAFVSTETFPCVGSQSGLLTVCVIQASPQHNFGGMVAVRLSPGRDAAS
jgi:hypothetical protein